MSTESALSELRQFMTGVVPYWETLGLELKEVSPGKAVFEAEATSRLLQNSIVHGGALASIADSACAVAAISMVFPESYATTINLQIAYLRLVTTGRFRAEGRCVRAGKSIIFSEASVYDENRALVCAASSQLMVVPRKE